jgi:hypothetical protein
LPGFYLVCAMFLMGAACACAADGNFQCDGRIANGDAVQELKLTGKNIRLKESNILFQDDFTDNTKAQWIPMDAISWKRGGGELELKWVPGGKLLDGQIFSAADFPSDVVLEFDAWTVPPSGHDIIWWWDARVNAAGDNWESGYLGALGGWYDNQAGIERLVCVGQKRSAQIMARTPLVKIAPGGKHRICSGSVDGLAFIFDNGKLIMEFREPPQNPTRKGRIGFGVYQSHIKISGLKVYKPEVQNVELSY